MRAADCLTVHVEANFLADGGGNAVAGQTEVDTRIVSADVRQRQLGAIVDHHFAAVSVSPVGTAARSRLLVATNFGRTQPNGLAVLASPGNLRARIAARFANEADGHTLGGQGVSAALIINDVGWHYGSNVECGRRLGNDDGDSYRRH